MELSDIRTQVRQRLGLSTNDTAVTDAILTSLINVANRKIALMHDWPWLVTVDTTWTSTVAGQIDYVDGVDLPTDRRKTLYILLNDRDLLDYKSQQDFARYRSITGYPAYYTTEGSAISLMPKPSAAIPVRHLYVKEVAELSLDADTPEMATSTDSWAVDALVELTSLLVCQRLRDKDLYTLAQNQWLDTLRSLRDEMRRTTNLPLPRHRNDIGWG